MLVAHGPQGDVTRTIGGGVSVEFTGLETVSTKQMATPKSGNAIVGKVALPPLSSLKRKGDEAGGPAKRGRDSDEARACNVGYSSKTPGLGLSVEHKVQTGKKKK